MQKYYTLSPEHFNNHGCRDYAVFQDNGDGTATCIEVESCTHRIHEMDHEYFKLGDTIPVDILIMHKDCLDYDGTED